MNESVSAQLLAQAKIDVKRPSAVELVDQVPDAVHWFRAQMTARPTLEDGDSRPSGKPGSKPPFRIAFMSAADREVAAMAYWAEQYGITVDLPLWRDQDGTVLGVFPDYIDDVVWDLSATLCATIERSFVVDGFFDHPKYGMWMIRSQHYGLWPRLAAIFTHETVEAELANPDEGEQMELL